MAKDRQYKYIEKSTKPNHRHNIFMKEHIFRKQHQTKESSNSKKKTEIDGQTNITHLSYVCHQYEWMNFRIIDHFYLFVEYFKSELSVRPIDLFTVWHARITTTK